MEKEYSSGNNSFTTTKLVLVLTSSLLGWMCISIIDHEIRLTKIEVSRFTTRDAKELAMECEMRMEKLATRLEQMPEKIPPEWFKKLVYDNKRAIEELRKSK